MEKATPVPPLKFEFPKAVAETRMWFISETILGSRRSGRVKQEEEKGQKSSQS